MSIPSGFDRRELFVDARDLQSSDESGNNMTTEEYVQLLGERGKEKLAEAQLVESFSTTVRVLDPTYQYGVDFFLGDIITVTDERLGITIDAVVEGVRRSITSQGESMELVLGFGQPTVYDILKRKAAR